MIQNAQLLQLELVRFFITIILLTNNKINAILFISIEVCTFEAKFHTLILKTMNLISKWQFSVALFLFIGLNTRAQINVSDGFETRQLSKIWSTDRMEIKSFEIQSTIVRKGKSAAKITIHTGDKTETGTGTSANSERDELLEDRSLVSIEGSKYEYKFSMFLPETFPIVSTRLVIAQWKQYCPSGQACSDDSPVVAIRYQSGKLFVTLQTDSGRVTLYTLKDEIRNRWLDFKFQIRFSKQNNGEILAFLNDQEIVHFNGIVSYSENRGYLSKNWYYFKMGLYRNIMPEPMTIYIDEYSKKEIVE